MSICGEWSPDCTFRHITLGSGAFCCHSATPRVYFGTLEHGYVVTISVSTFKIVVPSPLPRALLLYFFLDCTRRLLSPTGFHSHFFRVMLSSLASNRLSSSASSACW